MIRRDGDLFEVANSLARLIDAPITIEDQDTIVVAYSSGEQDVDDARISTILGRQVPVRYREAVAADGVLDRLARSDDVIMVNLPEVQMVPRAVVAIRDGEVLVGSIWAAVTGSLSAAQSKQLRGAAPVIARHLRHARERADLHRRERSDLVVGLIGGGDRAEAIAADLDLRGPWAVVAMRGDTNDVPRQVWGAFSLHLSAIAPSAVCAPLDHTVYGVLAAEPAPRLMADFMERFSLRHRLVVGIGSTSVRASSLAESRSVADGVAECLRRRGRVGVAASLTDVFADVLVDRLEAYVLNHPEASPLQRLVEHDRQHQAGLVDAVRAFLESGDIARAARSLHVHPNTARNRVRRAREQCGVDVNDPDTRLALMIALRVAGGSGSPATSAVGRSHTQTPYFL